MLEKLDVILKRMGFKNCEHDENVRTAGKFVTCSICKRQVLMARFTRVDDDE